MDRETARRVTEFTLENLTERFREAADEFDGVTFVATKDGGVKYDPTTGSVTIKITIAPHDAKPVGQTDFEMFAPQIKLAESDFGREFDSGGERFRITGFNHRAKRYPIQAERVRDGKGFKFPGETVCVALYGDAMGVFSLPPDLTETARTARVRARLSGADWDGMTDAAKGSKLTDEIADVLNADLAKHGPK